MSLLAIIPRDVPDVMDKNIQSSSVYNYPAPPQIHHDGPSWVEQLNKWSYFQTEEYYTAVGMNKSQPPKITRMHCRKRMLGKESQLQEPM